MARAGGIFAKGTCTAPEDFAAADQRLESPDYEGHSLANLRRVAEVLHERVRVVFEPAEKSVKRAAQPIAPYRDKRATAK